MILDLPAHLDARRRTLLERAAARIDAASGGDLLALVLSGSAGRGRETAHSDLDLYAVLDGDRPAPPPTRSTELDELPIRLTDLQRVPAFGSEGWGHRWSFAWAPILLDRTDGAVERAVLRQAILTPKEADEVLIDHGRLDGWLNLAYRAAKSHRAHRLDEARLDAAESIPWLLDVVFAFEGRVRPYNGYLSWELEQHPLTALPDASVLEIVRGLLDGERAALQDAFALVVRLAKSHDADPGRREVAAVLDGWGDDLDLLRST